MNKLKAGDRVQFSADVKLLKGLDATGTYTVSKTERHFVYLDGLDIAHVCWYESDLEKVGLNRKGYMNKLELFKKVYELSIEGDTWLDKVPHEISDSVFNNPYSTSLQRTIDLLISYSFTKEEEEWVGFFLYEWSTDKSLSVDIYETGNSKQKRITFDTFNDIADFLVEYEGWDPL